MKTKFLIITLFFLGSATFSFAQSSKTPVVRERQENQARRINQGRKSGELTKKETVGLAHQQVHIQQNKREAKADGEVTMRERAKLQNQQNRASRSIARQKNDGQGRN